MTDIFLGIGNFLTWTFGLLPILGNAPNMFFILIGTVLFIYWMLKLSSFGKEDKPMDKGY